GFQLGRCSSTGDISQANACEIGFGAEQFNSVRRFETKTELSGLRLAPYIKKECAGIGPRTLLEEGQSYLLADWAGVSFSSRGVIETTIYSCSLSFTSGTRRMSLSLLMRNWAISPIGSSIGCLSSLGRMR